MIKGGVVQFRHLLDWIEHELFLLRGPDLADVFVAPDFGNGDVPSRNHAVLLRVTGVALQT